MGKPSNELKSAVHWINSNELYESIAFIVDLSGLYWKSSNEKLHLRG